MAEPEYAFKRQVEITHIVRQLWLPGYEPWRTRFGLCLLRRGLAILGRDIISVNQRNAEIGRDEEGRIQELEAAGKG